MKKIAYIEAVRGFAATYVFVGHLVLNNFSEMAHWTILFHFGQEATMVFFVLSGFVIMYSTELSADKSFCAYIGRRFFVSIRSFCLRWCSVTPCRKGGPSI